MTTYYVDDGGSATSPYDTWAKAATSLTALDVAVAFAAGDIIYVGSDHVCQYTHSANTTIVGPTSGVPVKIISASTADTTYAKSTTNQIDTSEGAYDLTLQSNFSLYGIKSKVGDALFLTNQNDAQVRTYGCTFLFTDPAINFFNVSGTHENLTIVLPDTTNTSNIIGSFDGRYVEINGLVISDGSYRTNYMFSVSGILDVKISGADFSSFTNAAVIEVFGTSACNGPILISNSIMPASWNPWNTNNPRIFGSIRCLNCGPADDPTYLAFKNYWGELFSSNSIYRTGGATLETEATSWLVSATTANCSEASPFVTDWIYGEVSSAGSKTFDVYITNDTADFTDAQVWLEVEYLGTADEANTTLVSDHRTITTTAANQTDDTASTWNGTGPSFTYKQKLSVTATVGEAGMYRARVCIGVASIASSRYFYIDPKVTVS